VVFLGPGVTWQIIVLILLLCLSAFFSAAETALMSLSKIRLRHMVDEEVKGAGQIEKLVENPSKLLGTILVGNNIANVIASSLATLISIRLLGEGAVGIGTGIISILIIIFAEITPKSLAAQNSEKLSLMVAKPIAFLIIVFKPIVAITTYIANGLITLLGGKPNKNQPYITEDELKTIVDVSEEEGVLEIEEKEMIYNVFEFGDLQVKDIMVQRVDIAALEQEASYEETMEIIKREQFSRIPVYKETIDNIVGILNVKDLLMLDKEMGPFSIEKYMREPFYTFEFKKITDLFRDMKKEKNHMAVVLDEYGGTVGIVTIEDVVEEIVGDISDEYDEDETEIDVVKEDEYIVSGSVRLDEINDLIGTTIESEEFDSVGGFIIGQLGRLPEASEQVEYNNIIFKIENIDKNRIRKVRIFT
jgi:CBS domain containing-hemolysin-like protein